MKAATQSVLDPYGPHADAVSALSWILFGGGAIVFALVAVVAACAIWAGPSVKRTLARRSLVVYGGIVFPTVVLTVLFVYSLTLARDLVPQDASDLRVEVIGHQWWWRVRYLDAAGSVDFVTANELQLPAGRRVELVLRSADVIHSFWVPALAGKLDMIPGHVNRLRVAAREGVMRGQCAEYCGGPHALMALHVVALAPAEFERWAEAQRARARHPGDGVASRGQLLFMSHCSACHTVRGTDAQGELGPDLTHVGSRAWIGAGILPNTPANVAAWIRASQRLKPGNLMPSLDHFEPADLDALAAYMSALE